MADAPTYAELVAQVAELQEPTTLQQLPLKALQSYLETEWQPDSGLLLQPASITEDLMADDAVGPSALTTAVLSKFLKLAAPADLHMAFGVATLVFTASGSSATTTVTHGLVNSAGAALAPSLILIGNAWIPTVAVVDCGYDAATISATTFRLAATTHAGAITANVPISWAAIG